MKIGVLCCEKTADPHIIARELYNKGIKIVELGYNNKFTSKEIRKIKDYDLDLSLHCPFKDLRIKHSFIYLLLNRPKFYFRRFAVKEIEKSFSAAEELEATHYVLHGGGFPRGYYRFESFRKNSQFVDAFINHFRDFFVKNKDSNVRIVLENLIQGSMFVGHSEIRRVLQEFPWIGFCFDFAHSELSNQTESLRRLEFEEVHISDNDLRSDSHLAIGKGRIDFIKLFKILKAKGYDGKVIVECQNIQDAVDSFRSLKRRFLIS